MASVNQATVIGFVGDEPKITTSQQSGTKIASFSIATTEKGYTKQDGKTIPDKTEWHNIVVFSKLAEIIERFVHKGSSLYVQGKMRTRSYDDKNGIKRYITEIHADTIQMLDRRQDQGQQQQNYATSNGFYGNPNQYQQSNDDVPF